MTDSNPPSPQPPPVAPPTVRPPPVVAPPPREVALDEQGNIAEPVECRSCGYDLHGLFPASGKVCPECSLPIARSLRGDELRYSDPAWVGRLRKGILLILCGIVGTFVFGILYGIGIMVFAARGGGAAPTANAMMLAMSFIIALPWIVAIVGVWFVTAPDPGQVESEAPFCARKLARWCLMTAVISIPLQMMGSNTNTLAGTNPANAFTPAMQAVMGVGVLVGLATLVGYVAGYKHLSRLARRIPSASLERHAVIVMWGYGCAKGANALFGLITIFLMPSIMAAAMGAQNNPAAIFTPGMIFMMAGGSVVGCASLIFAVWGLVLLIIIFFAFKREAQFARENWQV